MGDQRIYLIGPMGAGKSTVGRALAYRLGAELVDLDEEIVHVAGKPVPEIFAEEGEAGFREREARALADLAGRDEALVVATGGGVVLREENRQVMARSGTTVYLHADVDTLLARTRGDSNRPLLQVADPRAQLTQLQAEREPLYREAALTVATDGRTPQDVAGEILTRLPATGDDPVN